MAAAEEFLRARSLLSDWRWRLNNLYYITDKEGRRTKFEMNWAQEQLFEEMHYLSLILKARQLGFTTFLQLFMLDACVFNTNIRAGVIAHTREDAEGIFRDKIKFPYDNLPDQLRAAVPIRKNNTTVLELGNNSIIRVGTSMRGGTLNYLHVSEFGKICAKYPHKAREVITGSLNAVEAGQIAWIESTAEGQEGRFYEMCETAQASQRRGDDLTPLDWKFFFFPWWKHPGYRMDPAGVTITAEYDRYFGELINKHGVILTAEQKAWYAKKAETQGSDMKREYPSTPAEAFEAVVEGAYYGDQMAAAELAGRIGDFPHQPGAKVHTFWDIGVGDYTAIWFVQITPKEIHVIDYYQNSGEGAPHYLMLLERHARERGYSYGDHWLPHDVSVKEWGTGRTRIEQLGDGFTDPVTGQKFVGIKAKPIPRHYVEDGINAVRSMLALCWFDKARTSEGVAALKGYRHDYDEKLGVWKKEPRHDWSSHGADAFRGLAMAYREMKPDPAPAPKPRAIVVGGNTSATLDDLWAENRTTEKWRV